MVVFLVAGFFSVVFLLAAVFFAAVVVVVFLEPELLLDLEEPLDFVELEVGV